MTVLTRTRGTRGCQSTPTRAPRQAAMTVLTRCPLRPHTGMAANTVSTRQTGRGCHDGPPSALELKHPRASQADRPAQPSLLQLANSLRFSSPGRSLQQPLTRRTDYTLSPSSFNEHGTDRLLVDELDSSPQRKHRGPTSVRRLRHCPKEMPRRAQLRIIPQPSGVGHCSVPVRFLLSCLCHRPHCDHSRRCPLRRNQTAVTVPRALPAPPFPFRTGAWAAIWSAGRAWAS